MIDKVMKADMHKSKIKRKTGGTEPEFKNENFA